MIWFSGSGATTPNTGSGSQPFSIPSASIDTTNRSSVLKTISSSKTAAEQKYADAGNKMQSGLNALLGANPAASTNKIRQYGGQVAGIAGDITPLAGDVTSLGGEIGGIGREINATGGILNGLGLDILNMNANSSSPLVQALLGLYNANSPDRLASMAGQDVANQYDVARGAQARQLSRQGVNPSSGRYISINQLANDLEATAKAAAMTRASMAGLDRQSEFLRTNIADLGKSMISQGVSAKAQGAGVLGNAIGADNTAAGMLANAASVLNTAAGLEKSAADMDLGFAKDVMGQNNAMSQLDVATGNYYGNLFSELLSYDSAQMQQQASGGGGGFTVSRIEDLHGNAMVRDGNGNWQAFNKTDDGFVPAK